MRGVVIGGGTGAPKSIRALLSLGYDVSALVAMADDGGSTGILRDLANATPPGDIRKCLVAMAKDPDDPFVRAFQQRFSFADDHALGNLVLYALEQQTGSFPEAIAQCERLISAQGHVYPSTLSDVTLSAQLSDGSCLQGQARVSHAPLPVQRIWLNCTDEIVPYGPALDALRGADAIVLGPGSLFTSVIVNLSVPGIVESIREGSARVVFVCPVGDTQGEAAGMSARQCYEALCDAGLDGIIDDMLVHWPQDVVVPETCASVDLCPEARSVAFGEDDRIAIEAAGTHVHVVDMTQQEMPTWHDEDALAQALRTVL